MIRRHPLLLLATLPALAPPAAAQQAPAVPDVVVTGRGTPPRPGDRAFDVVQIDAARVRENAANRLESVLADAAGLQQFRRSDSRSANPTSQGITLRGLGGNASSRALLLLDGVPQADPFGGWVPFPAYATDRIGLIRVTRGGGSGYAGPGALAGTVEIESAGPADAPGLVARAAGGSRDSADLSGSAMLVRPGGFATLSAAYARGDGFVPVVAEDRGPADRAAPYHQFSAAARTVIRAGDTAEVQASLSGFADARDRGTDFTRNRSRGTDASVRLVGRGRWEFSALAYIQARDFASQFAAIDPARRTASPTLDQYGTPSTGLGARVEVRPPPSRGTDVRLGADLRSVTGRTQENYSYVTGAPTRRRVAGGDALTAGLFADGSVERGPWTATLGGRVDRWRIEDGRLVERSLAGGAASTSTRFPDRDGTEWTGRAGLAWVPVTPVTLRVAAYRGWRLPTLNELYRPFRVGADAVAANAALAPERVTGFDGGAALKLSRGFTLSTTVFRDRLAGAIANVTRGRGPGNFPGVGFVAANGTYRVRENLDAVRSTGIEVDARWDRGPWWTAASWSRTAARVRAPGAAAGLDGLRPAQTPRDLVSASAGWRREGAAASATLRHAARQFEDDQNSRTLAPATTLDAFGTLPLGPALAAELRAENLFDERVEAGINGADVVERATPRTIWVGLRLRG